MTNWIDWPATAQMLTAIAAIGALFIAPLMTARNERRARVSASRQAWLDAIRGDIATLLPNHAMVLALREFVKDDEGQYSKEALALTEKSDRLEFLIRLRLNLDRPDHLALNRAVAAYTTSPDIYVAFEKREEIVHAMDAITSEVWRQIKSGSVT
jgi:hypothetical protein